MTNYNLHGLEKENIYLSFTTTLYYYCLLNSSNVNLYMVHIETPLWYASIVKI